MNTPSLTLSNLSGTSKSPPRQQDPSWAGVIKDVLLLVLQPTPASWGGTPTDVRVSSHSLSAPPWGPTTSAGQLARCVRAYGERNADSALVRQTLLKYLFSPSALVQEAAIYGLWDHTNPDVLNTLRDLASRTETSKSVRDAIASLLEG